MKVKYLLACLASLLVMSCTVVEQPEPDENDQKDPAGLEIGADSDVIEGGF